VIRPVPRMVGARIGTPRLIPLDWLRVTAGPPVVQFAVWEAAVSGARLFSRAMFARRPWPWVLTGPAAAYAAMGGPVSVTASRTAVAAPVLRVKDGGPGGNRLLATLRNVS